MPPRGRQLCFTFPSPPGPLFKAPKAPFLTLRVATLSGAPRQAPLDSPPPTRPVPRHHRPTLDPRESISSHFSVDSSRFRVATQNRLENDLKTERRDSENAETLRFFTQAPLIAIFLPLFLRFSGDFLRFLQKTGRPRFGSVMVRGWNGSSGSGFRFRRFLCKKGFSAFQYSFNRKGRFRFRFLEIKRFRRFRFRFRFREKRFRRFRFPVPVRFLSHPEKNLRFESALIFLRLRFLSCANLTSGGLHRILWWWHSRHGAEDRHSSKPWRYLPASRENRGSIPPVVGQEWPWQTKPKKGQFMNFSQGHSGTKVQCEPCLFS